MYADLFIISCEKFAEKALELRCEILRNLKKSPCVILSEYARVKNEEKQLRKYLIEKRKERLFGGKNNKSNRG